MARIDDFISNSSLVILERIKNPFFVSLISAWIYQHRFDILSLFKSKNNYDDIINIIESEFLIWSRDGFGQLLWFTFLLFFTYTFFSQLVYALNALAQKVLRPFLTRWFDRYGYAPAHDLREALDSLSNVESKMREIEKLNREMEEERKAAIKSESKTNKQLLDFQNQKERLQSELDKLKTSHQQEVLDFEILFAKYGIDGSWRDVTELIKKRAGKDGTKKITVKHASWRIKDPAPGKEKTLQVIYRRYGQIEERVFDENSTIILRDLGDIINKQ